MKRSGCFATGPNVAESKALRHEFEYGADAFAQGSMRSALYSRLRSDWQSGQEPAVAVDSDRGGLEALQDHQREVSGVRLLFAYMEVIDQIGQLFKRRLGDAIPFREQLDSHPSARERLARLDVLHIGEHVPTSQVLRYAESFFAEILAYAGSLDDAALAESLQDLY